VVRLNGEGESSCQTPGLDHPDNWDYYPSHAVTFSGPELGECNSAELGGLQGGVVTWTGPGLFAAKNREICVGMVDGSVSCCSMQDSFSASNVPVTLENCKLQS